MTKLQRHPHLRLVGANEPSKQASVPGEDDELTIFVTVPRHARLLREVSTRLGDGLRLCSSSSDSVTFAITAR